MRYIALLLTVMFLFGCEDPVKPKPEPAKLEVQSFMAWHYVKSRICIAYIKVANVGDEIAENCNAVFTLYDSLGRQTGYEQIYFCRPLNLYPYWEGVIQTTDYEYDLQGLLYSKASYPTQIKALLQPGRTEVYRPLTVVQ